MEKSENEKNDEAKQNLQKICFFCGKNKPNQLPLPSHPVGVAKIELLLGRKFNKLEYGPQTMCSSCDGHFTNFQKFYQKHNAVEETTKNRLGLNPPTNDDDKSNDGDDGSVDNNSSAKETNDDSVDNDTSELESDDESKNIDKTDDNTVDNGSSEEETEIAK